VYVNLLRGEPLRRMYAGTDGQGGKREGQHNSSASKAQRMFTDETEERQYITILEGLTWRQSTTVEHFIQAMQRKAILLSAPEGLLASPALFRQGGQCPRQVRSAMAPLPAGQRRRHLGEARLQHVRQHGGEDTGRHSPQEGGSQARARGP